MTKSEASEIRAGVKNAPPAEVLRGMWVALDAIKPQISPADQGVYNTLMRVLDILGKSTAKYPT
jgi:hypothetical protein